jgi:hypothetical protein
VKEKSPASSKDKGTPTKPRKRLKRAVKESPDVVIDVAHNSKPASNLTLIFVLAKGKGKGETSDEYFEKFAQKDAKGKKNTGKQTPKKGGRRNKREVSSSEDDYAEDPEELKEVEDCVSESLDLDEVVDSDDDTEKVEETIVTRKRTANQVKEEVKKESKNVKFDDKKKVKTPTKAHAKADVQDMVGFRFLYFSNQTVKVLIIMLWNHSLHLKI